MKRTEDEYLVALANLLINELPEEHNDIIDRWCSAVCDGVSDKDKQDIKDEYGHFEEYFKEPK